MTSNINVELWEIGRLVPYANNPKRHSAAQIDALSKLIKKNGWTQPIVVDGKGVIILGHGRRLAAMKLGLERVPVICRADVTEDEARAMRLADNRVASTDYDTAMVQIELSQLASIGFDLELTAYDDKELEFLTADLGEIDTNVFVEDVGEAVETQAKENAQKEREIDEAAAPITDALGFRRCTVAQSREIRGFMTEIEKQTGAKGADALLSHFKTALKAA